MQNTLSLTGDTCLYAVGGRARKGSEKGRQRSSVANPHEGMP